MEEEKVHAVPLVADAQAPLTADEGKIPAKLEQEPAGTVIDGEVTNKERDSA